MLVVPRPGVNRENLRDSLRSVFEKVSNIQGCGPQGAQQRLVSYLAWASDAVEMLHSQISNTDLERLVLTKRYEQLLSGAGGLSNLVDERVLNSLVSLELRQRVDTFKATIEALEGQIQRWKGYGHFVVPDTSFFIEHDQKLEEVDFRPLINVWQSPVNIVVPIVVVDELDGLKQSKDRRVRWRTGYTLAVLDRVFAETSDRAQLRAGGTLAAHLEEKGAGEITIELVFDPPGHVRLPINDDEIIDRTLAIEPLAARKVTLLTYDTGQSTRARAVGLEVRKLRKSIGDEPT